MKKEKAYRKERIAETIIVRIILPESGKNNNMQIEVIHYMLE